MITTIITREAMVWVRRAIAGEVLGVGAPIDSVQYKAEIEQLDSDPFGPDPELLTDDANPCALCTHPVSCWLYNRSLVAAYAG